MYIYILDTHTHTHKHVNKDTYQYIKKQINLYQHLHLLCIYTSNTFTPPMHLHLQCIYTSNAFTPPMHLHLQCIYTSNAFTPPIPASELLYTHKHIHAHMKQVHLYTSNAVQRLNTHTNHTLTHLDKSIFTPPMPFNA